jgi:hypothetical protein
VVFAIECDQVLNVERNAMAEIGDPVREIEIVPREEPVPTEAPVEVPAVPDEELIPA